MNHPSPVRGKNGLVSITMEAGSLAEALGMSTEELIRAVTILWNDFFFVDGEFY